MQAFAGGLLAASFVLLWWFGHWWRYIGCILFLPTILLLLWLWGTTNHLFWMAYEGKPLLAANRARYTEDIFCRLGAWKPQQTSRSEYGTSYADMWKRLGSKIADELQVAAETSGGSIARGSSCV